MTEFEKILKQKAGLLKDIESSLPPNQNNYKGSVEKSKLPPDEGSSSKVVKVSRSGESGKTEEIVVNRPDVPDRVSHTSTKPAIPRVKTPGVRVVMTGEGTTKNYDSTHEISVAERKGSRASLQPVVINRSGSRSQLTDIETERSGSEGTHTDVHVKREGTEGRHSDINIERSGTDGVKGVVPITRSGSRATLDDKLTHTERSGSEGTHTEVHVKREGTDGHPSEVNIERSGESGKTGVVIVNRTGSRANLPDVTAQRAGTPGVVSDIRTQREGTAGKTSDIQVPRPGLPGQDSSLTRPGVPDDSNPSGLNEKNSLYNKVTSGLDAAERITRQISHWIGVPDFTQVNTTLKALTGGRGVEVVTGFDAKNVDLIAYFKHLMQNGWNFGRIPLDIALRYLLIPADHDLRTIGRTLYTGEGNLQTPGLKQLNESLLKLLNPEDKRTPQYKGTRALDYIKRDELNEVEYKTLAPNTNSSSDIVKGLGGYSDIGQYLGYKLSDGKIIEVASLISSMLKRHGYNEPFKTNELVKPTNDDEIFFTTRNRLSGFEMADNFYWGLRIQPYKGSSENLLPDFPEEFSHGWWPVISCSFTKGSLKSKSFAFPYFDLEIPQSGERPSNLKISVLDNVKHAIRYWTESYIEKCFDIDNNAVLPYKNILWDITVYQYDCTLNVMYKKRLICILVPMTALFNGEVNHNYDELDLEYEIVGEFKETH